MDQTLTVLHSPVHQELINELLSLNTAEDRLSWLMERTPLHSSLTTEDRIDARKVPGCLSGLWLKAETRDNRCFFSAFSESDLVHGVVSYLCDLYSTRSPIEILELGSSLAVSLKLEGLLSTTRRRAVASTLSFFAHAAGDSLNSTSPSTQSAA